MVILYSSREEIKNDIKKEKVIDYQKVMREFDESLVWKTDDAVVPLEVKFQLNGEVDYQAASDEYQEYLIGKEIKKIRTSRK